MADLDNLSEINVVEWPLVGESRATRWLTSVNPPGDNPNGADEEWILGGSRAGDVREGLTFLAA